MPSEVPIEVARAAGPFMLCADWHRKCPATAGGLEAGFCVGGYAVDGDDWLRCHAEY